MMGEDYVRIYPEDEVVRLISNNGACIASLLDWLRERDEVEDIELEDGGISDYVLPSENPAAPGNEAIHNLYHYVVMLAGDQDAERFAEQIAATAEILFSRAGQMCEVSLQV